MCRDFFWVSSPGVLVAVVDITGLPSFGHIAHDPDPPRHPDLVVAHLLHCRVTTHVKQVGNLPDDETEDETEEQTRYCESVPGSPATKNKEQRSASVRIPTFWGGQTVSTSIHPSVHPSVPQKFQESSLSPNCHLQDLVTETSHVQIVADILHQF